MISKEELLIRSGNLANPLGLFRAIYINNNEITREKFVELIKKNWGLIENESLDEYLTNKVNNAWKWIKHFLEDLEILEFYSEDKIKIREIKLEI